MEDFVNKWWQVQLATGVIGNCYLFNVDGNVIESDGDNKWIAGTWDSIEEECEFVVYNEDTEFRLLSYDDECWDILYENNELKACECEL